MQDTHKIKTNYSDFSPKYQEILSLCLTISPCPLYAFRTVAKSTVSRRKLNKLAKVNTSTPENRAFFVRSFRTPKKYGSSRLFSMVGRNRHAYAWLVVLCYQYSYPVTPYRPNCRKFSGSSSKLSKGLSAMIYLFQCVNRYAPNYQEQIVFIHANNAENARLTAQQTEKGQFMRNFRLSQNQRLQNQSGLSSIFGTTKNTNGNRTRQICGFFVSQISRRLGGFIAPENYPNFAVRLISRNKAEFIRTNKASRLVSVVETVSHPFSGISFKSLTKILIMIYKFLSIQGKKRLKITIHANSKAEALSRIQWLTNPLCIACNIPTISTEKGSKQC